MSLWVVGALGGTPPGPLLMKKKPQKILGSRLFTACCFYFQFSYKPALGLKRVETGLQDENGMVMSGLVTRTDTHAVDVCKASRELVGVQLRFPRQALPAPRPLSNRPANVNMCTSPSRTKKHTIRAWTS